MTLTMLLASTASWRIDAIVLMHLAACKRPVMTHQLELHALTFCRHALRETRNLDGIRGQ